jgi:hypothetical protein
MERRTGEGGEEGRRAQEEPRAWLGARRVEGGEEREGAREEGTQEEDRASEKRVSYWIFVLY